MTREYLNRPRLNQLLAEAVKYPVTIVCAGTGYGKTRAVSDFTRWCAFPSVWIQFSERDNAGSRFWAKYIQLAAGWDKAFIKQCQNIGFPDSEDKLNIHFNMRKRYAPADKHLIVLDDFHLINHPDILLFLERFLLETADNTPIILICREYPRININSIWLRGLVPAITENELVFTENEMSLYINQCGLTVSDENRLRILDDTKGWAFSIHLVVNSLKKSPGYMGYVRTAMKRNIFMMMETEVFNHISERLQRFLVRLSLIDHLSAGLIAVIAAGDTGLISEMERQNAYIRFDSDINAYLIHNLFLDFLRTKENILTQAEITFTYRAAAGWCALNGFEIDALIYLEKIGDYATISAMLRALPSQIPYDIVKRALVIFERAPADTAEHVLYFAVMHVRIYIQLGRMKEAFELIRRYEERFLALPEADAFRNKNLGEIYFCWGNMSALMCTVEDCGGYSLYYAKADTYLTKTPSPPYFYADMPVGFWVSLVGSPRKGAPQEYIEEAVRAVKSISHFWSGASAGTDILCKGELLFYQGDMSAETYCLDALKLARDCRQAEIEQRALFYLTRIALLQGARGKAEQRLKEMNKHMIYNHDAALAWYYCVLRQPDMIPAWLKENFAPYSHSYFIENIGNQIKARYHYLTHNFPPLLAYIEDVMRRESILYGRIEMLVLKACVHFHTNDKLMAVNALREAYEEAYPNEIIMPFIELGKDMRTFAGAVLKERSGKIPEGWLETVRRKSATFAKYQSAMIYNFKNNGAAGSAIKLSARESEILSDIYNGLSRPEIAVKHSLSVNTVNSAAGNIYNKLGARNIADVIRIASEEKLVSTITPRR